jgi:bifunctional non-homologous end joining protein LigD
MAKSSCGVSNFDALASRKHDKRAQLYAFDTIASDGEDLRPLPLSLRKRNLARLLRRRVDGIFVAEYDAGEMKYDLFGAVCQLGFEGIVSKRCDRPYSAGKCKHWLKVKNPAHPAYCRVREHLTRYRT